MATIAGRRWRRLELADSYASPMTHLDPNGWNGPPLATERRTGRLSDFPDFVNCHDIDVQVTGRVALFGGGVSVFLRLGGLTRL